jgi:hypothetical protein
VTPVLLGLLVTIVLSIAIVLAVALPHLRGRTEPAGPSRGRVPSHRSRSFRGAQRHAAAHGRTAVLPPAGGPPQAQPVEPVEPVEPDLVIDLRDGANGVGERLPHPPRRH